MKKAKESSVKKSIRIPTDVVSELEKEAKQKFNNNFADAVVYRLKHFEAPLTPMVVSKVQNIVNTAISDVLLIEPEITVEMQKVVDWLWNYLK